MYMIILHSTFLRHNDHWSIFHGLRNRIMDFELVCKGHVESSPSASDADYGLPISHNLMTISCLCLYWTPRRYFLQLFIRRSIRRLASHIPSHDMDNINLIFWTFTNSDSVKK